MYDDQDIKPSRSFDDIDREIRGQQRPPALKPPKPQKSFDDIAREVETSSVGVSSASVFHPKTDQHRGYTTNYNDGYTEATKEQWGDKPLPTYEAWRKSDSKVVPPDFSRYDTYKSPAKTPDEIRAKQAALTARQIESTKKQAAELFKQADQTPDVDDGTGLSARAKIRAQAEGRLATANELARRAQKRFSDHLEIGFGKDSDPNSKREWAYAKPKSQMARIGADEAAMEAGNLRRQQQMLPIVSPQDMLSALDGINSRANEPNAAEQRALLARQQVAEEARRQMAAQNPGKVSRFILGAGSVPTHALAGLASIPRRITGDDAGQIETGLGALGDVMAAGSQPTPETQGVFSAGNLGTVAGFIPTMGVGGRALAPFTPESALGSALSAGAQFGNIAAGQGVSNKEVLKQGLIGGGVGVASELVGGAAKGALAKRVASAELTPTQATVMGRGAQALSGGGAFAGQSALMGQRDPETLAKEALLGGVMGAMHNPSQNRAAVRSVANERPNLPTDIRPTTLGPTQVTPVPGARPATSAQPTVDVQPHVAQNDFQKHFALRYQNGQFTLDEAIPLEQAPPQNVKALVDVLQGFQTKPDVPPEMAGAARNLLQQVQSRLSQTTPTSGVAEPPPAFPRLPEPEGFNARRAKLLGMDVPSEIAINERIAQADKLLGSQNESDQRLGKRILKQSLEEIQKSEGYQGELGQPDDAPKPYTAVRQAIEEKLSKKFSESQNSLAKVSLKNETATPAESTVPLSKREDARLKAIEFEQQAAQQVAKSLDSGRFRDAQDGLRRQKDALAQQRRLIDRSTVEGQTEYRRLGDQIQGVQRQQEAAKAQARQMARQANAPTRGLAEGQRDKIPNNFVRAENNNVPAETAPLLRPEAVQNPEAEHYAKQQGKKKEPWEMTRREWNNFHFDENKHRSLPEDYFSEHKFNAPKDKTKLVETIPGGIEIRQGEYGIAYAFDGNKNVGMGDGKAFVVHPDYQKQGIGKALLKATITGEPIGSRTSAGQSLIESFHESSVKDALNAGKAVPAEVLADYPNLQNQQPAKSFDQIAADVDSETGALQRAIDRSNEREHAMPSEGVGLVSMSPYADMVTRNRDAVDRLYQSGMASQEGKEIFRNLREFAAKNGIEARHLHALADDVRNVELEKARWADRGIDFSTVQSLNEGTARLRDSVLEDAKSLPNVERTALEREVAALDALFDDPNATNLLERAAEGDNNAANGFRKVANEYGIGAETIGDLIEARKPNRSANRAPRQNEARTPQSAGRDTRAAQEREARSATPEEFDLLNRNPATIPTDEFDAHLTAMEKLRNDEIRGIVKLSREDKREMFRQLRNLNEERKFRVQRKELPAKFESRTLPVDKEFVRQSVEKATQPKVAERRSEPMPERYTLRQMADNATAQYREAANRPGVVYLNDWGGAFLNRTLDDVFGVTTTDANFTMGSKDAKDIVSYIRDVQKDTGHDVSRIADELEKAITSAEAKGQDVAFVTRKPSEPLSLTKTKVRHESTHLSQSRLAEDLSTLTGNKWLDTQDNASTIRQELDRRGYPAETHDYEAAAFVASGDYGVFGMDTNQAASFLSDYFNAVVQRHGQRALQKFGAIDPKLQPTLEAARNENPTESQTISGRTSQEAAGVERASRQRSGDAGNVPSISERRERRDQEKSRIRASFGELENEPRGQVAASGLGGLQNLFSRKAKTSASTELVELPKDWDTSKWARKTYTDALSNALSTKDRAELAKLKTDKERNSFLLSAKVDPDIEAKVFKIIDRATDALEKGDGAGVAAARKEAKDLLAGQISSTNRDVKWYDHLQSRLSNVNFKGTYERIAGEQGKEISEIFRNAQVDAANGKLTRSDVVNRLNQELKPYIRRLKSAGKPGLARWVETHIDAVSDPDQSFSGLAGFLKGFQYNTKLRLNPRSALVNSLQPLQTLWPHLTTREWAKLQVEAAKPSTWRRISETAARESGGSVENVNDKKKFMGWADVFTPVSEYNRIVGHLAGELFADRNGLTGDAKARMAADWAKKVEFDNSAYDIPPLFSGKIAGVVGQFKPFMVKNIERIVADWKSAPPEALATNNWKGAGTIARRAKMITAQVAIGGVRSAVPGLKTIGGVLILGGLAKGFSKFMDDDKAEKLAEAVYFGAPALVEQDLSGSVAVFDEPFGKTAYEKLVNFGGGPTLSLIAKAYEEGKNINEAKDSKNSTKTEKQKAAGMRLAKAVTPYMKTAETAYDLATGKQPELFMGKPKPMTKMEIGGKLLMGTPLRQSKYYEQKEAFDWQKKLMPDRFEKEESKKTRVSEDGKIETRVTKQKPGEPEAVFNERKTRVEGWMDTYGQKLLDSPRYKAMTDDEQKAAMKLLRNRIGRQQNLKQPKPNSFEPNAVLLGVKKSAATKTRRQSKYLYQP